jgi:hypothetical protein
MNTTGDATVDNANQNLEPTEKPENDPDVKVAKKKQMLVLKQLALIHHPR